MKIAKKFATKQPRIWRWWKCKKSTYNRKKWNSLEHNGPLFPPDYETLPRNVKFYYDGIPMSLSKAAEEVAGFYAKMLKDKHTKRKTFNENFFRDWRKVMTAKERAVIVDFKKCNFLDLNRFYEEEADKTIKARNRDKIKKKKDKLAARYGFCLVDGKIQKVLNFRMEPPGLFKGRGNHPQMGKLKKRVLPEDVTINIGKDAAIPKPPPDHKWKEVVHNNTVEWLAKWKNNLSNSAKYMVLHPSSKLKGQKEIQKYELARKLKRNLRDIRKKYMKDLQSLDEYERQMAVVTYFIDRFCLRTGYKKESETADTVGCCSLRVEHISLNPRFENRKYVIHLDFPGKDSIRYRRSVPVDIRVYKNLQGFLKYKHPQSLVFDTLNPSLLNKYLKELMDNLTAKVFRTCNASTEMENQLTKMTKKKMSLEGKLQVYNMANRSAALLCNHRQAVPKTYDKSIKNIEKKIKAKAQEIRQIEKEIGGYKRKSGRNKNEAKKLRKMKLLHKQIEKLLQEATIKVQNRGIALNPTKLNYLDPRITVAWCKKWEVPINKIYNKTQSERFMWAIETTDANFKF